MSEREKRLELRIAELEGELKAYKEIKLKSPIIQIAQSGTKLDHCTCHPDLGCVCGKRYKAFGYPG